MLTCFGDYHAIWPPTGCVCRKHRGSPGNDYSPGSDTSPSTVSSVADKADDSVLWKAE